jgi:prefoldin subunit 5
MEYGMNPLKEINRKISEWQKAIHDVKNNDRESFINLVKIGSGDYIYAKDCTNEQALEQIRMELDSLQEIKEGLEDIESGRVSTTEQVRDELKI